MRFLSCLTDNLAIEPSDRGAAGKAATTKNRLKQEGARSCGWFLLKRLDCPENQPKGLPNNKSTTMIGGEITGTLSETQGSGLSAQANAGVAGVPTEREGWKGNPRIDCLRAVHAGETNKHVFDTGKWHCNNAWWLQRHNAECTGWERYIQSNPATPGGSIRPLDINKSTGLCLEFRVGLHTSACPPKDSQFRSYCITQILLLRRPGTFDFSVCTSLLCVLNYH